MIGEQRAAVKPRRTPTLHARCRWSRMASQLLAPELRHEPMSFAIAPPIEPMLAQVAEQLPAQGEFLFEPKWDGFRAIVFRSDDDVSIQSRDLKPLDRYFPELHDAMLRLLP